MTKKDTLKVESTVMLMNSLIKKDMKTTTNKSKILKTSPLTDMPMERNQEGQPCFRHAETVEIKPVHKFPVKTLLTIRGQII